MKKVLMSTLIMCVFSVAAFSQIQGAIQSEIANSFVTKEMRKSALTAAEHNNLTALKKVVEKQKQAAYVSDERGMTPLMFASENGNQDMVAYLLDKGAEINTEREYPNINYPEVNALFFALNNPSLTSFMLQKKADVTRSVMMKAIDSHQPTTLMLIQKIGKKGVRNENNKETGNSYLWHAARVGNVNAVTKLLQLGATFEPYKDLVHSPMHCAVENAYKRFSSQGVRGTVLEAFANHKDLKVSQANHLLEGIIVTATDHHSERATPAFALEATKMIVDRFYASHPEEEQKQLLRWKDSAGYTAQRFAKENGWPQVAAYLKSAQK